MMSSFFSWRHSTSASPVLREPASVRFDAAAAVTLSNANELAQMKPGFVRSLSTQFDVEPLANRLAPVLLDDGRVAIFALAEHVGSDQTDELARRIVQLGYTPASPERYVLAAPLLLALVRKQLTAQSLSGGPYRRTDQSRTALAAAFHDLLEWGVRHGASDLHLNVRLQEPESEVKYTVSGRYLAPERFRRIPTSTLMDMLSVAWMDIRGGNGAVFDPFLEQQGSMTKWVDGQNILLRWASLAADAGPSVCLRMLQQDAARPAPDLAELGYPPDQVEQIRRVVMSEGGAVIFAGTVGSGKSTTLASLICSLPPDRKVITIEDPVEYLIPGAVQNTLARSLDSAAHDAYAAKLRALKRSAMTDVLLGEIRDVETGRAFMDLAGSGVNVYTTVHAASASLIPRRLASDFIGVSSDFLATPGVLKLLVFQVLLPRLCAHCALPASSLADGGLNHEGRYHAGSQWGAWLAVLGSLYPDSDEAWRVRNPEGCAVCRKSDLPALHGYSGRSVAAEVIEPAVSMTSAGSAFDSAVRKGLAGEIDPRDIELRFEAFETVKRRNATQNSPSSAARLRAVP